MPQNLSINQLPINFLQFIPDVDSTRLDAGRLYFGLPYQSPLTNPANIFLDSGLSIYAPPYLLIKNGFMWHNGNVMDVFTDANSVSMLLLDVYGNTLFFIDNIDVAAVCNVISMPSLPDPLPEMPPILPPIPVENTPVETVKEAVFIKISEGDYINSSINFTNLIFGDIFKNKVPVSYPYANKPIPAALYPILYDRYASYALALRFIQYHQQFDTENQTLADNFHNVNYPDIGEPYLHYRGLGIEIYDTEELYATPIFSNLTYIQEQHTSFDGISDRINYVTRIAIGTLPEAFLDYCTQKDQAYNDYLQQATANDTLYRLGSLLCQPPPSPHYLLNLSFLFFKIKLIAVLDDNRTYKANEGMVRNSDTTIDAYLPYAFSDIKVSGGYVNVQDTAALTDTFPYF